jgi:hypothetical protein
MNRARLDFQHRSDHRDRFSGVLEQLATGNQEVAARE